MNRIRAACRTNDMQVCVVLVMTLIHAYQLSTIDKPAPLWLWAATLSFWPTVAFLVNLIDPIEPRMP